MINIRFKEISSEFKATNSNERKKNSETGSKHSLFTKYDKHLALYLLETMISPKFKTLGKNKMFITQEGLIIEQVISGKVQDCQFVTVHDVKSVCVHF